MSGRTMTLSNVTVFLLNNLSRLNKQLYSGLLTGKFSSLVLPTVVDWLNQKRIIVSSIIVEKQNFQNYPIILDKAFIKQANYQIINGCTKTIS